jgi:protein TonB
VIHKAEYGHLWPMKAEVTIGGAACGGRGAEPAFRASLRLPTLFAVAAVHIGLIASLCWLLYARHAPQPPAEISIPVVFAPAPEPAAPPPQILASSTLPLPSNTQTASLAPLPSMTVPAGRMGELPRLSLPRPLRDHGRTASVEQPRAPMSQAPSPPSPPAAISPVRHKAVAAAAPTQDTENALARWEVRIRQAVQNAAIYPPSARLLHRDGRAQVRFDYDQGAVERASIAQSSHFEALDNAALAAVTRAAIPNPPAELGPQSRTMLVWVQFTLETAE